MPRYAERIAASPVKAKAAEIARQPKRPAQSTHPKLSHVLQLRAAQSGRAGPAPAVPSRGALPAGLKAGLERLSGIAMDDVRVHRDSPAPARLGAFAYAQGSDIHLGPGQEQHLPHEAWHVVQQKQGRVRPNVARHGGVPINNDPALEAEAGRMGARAIQLRGADGGAGAPLPARMVPGIVQLVYANLAEVKDKKFLPTAAFTDGQKLAIANWCDRERTNAIHQHCVNEFSHGYSVSANNKSYHYGFCWSLALHVDFGGPSHGSVPTPHLQVVRSFYDQPGKKTTTPVAIIADGKPVKIQDRWLDYTGRANAIALTYAQAEGCMDAGNLNSVKAMIYGKVVDFAEDWARAHADDVSEAKKARADENPEDYAASLWD